MFRTMIVTGMAAAALTACGDPASTRRAGPSPPKAIKAAAPAGGRANEPIAAPSAVALPANLPAYVKLYPGATLASSMTSAPGGSRGGLIVYQTTATPSAVLSFHKHAAAEAGLKSSADTARGRGRGFTATGAAGAQVNVTVVPSPNGTFVQMSYD